MLDINPRASIDSIPFLLYMMEEEKAAAARQQDTNHRDRCYFEQLEDGAETADKSI